MLIFLLLILFIILLGFLSDLILMPIFGILVIFGKDIFGLPLYAAIQVISYKGMDNVTSFAKFIVFIIISVSSFTLLYLILRTILKRFKFLFYVLNGISSAWLALTSAHTFHKYITPSINAVFFKGNIKNVSNEIPYYVIKRPDIHLKSVNIFNFKIETISQNTLFSILYFILAFAIIFLIRYMLIRISIDEIDLDDTQILNKILYKLKLKKKQSYTTNFEQTYQTSDSDDYNFEYDDDNDNYNNNYNYRKEEDNKQNESFKKDYYSILDVSKNASTEEIKLAYKRQITKYHPDKNSGSENSTEITKLINEAYEVLSDPEKRDQYDRFGIVL